MEGKKPTDQGPKSMYEPASGRKCSKAIRSSNLGRSLASRNDLGRKGKEREENKQKKKASILCPKTARLYVLGTCNEVRRRVEGGDWDDRCCGLRSRLLLDSIAAAVLQGCTRHERSLQPRSHVLYCVAWALRDIDVKPSAGAQRGSIMKGGP